MYAAAYGSVDAMKTLIEAKADVNAKNAFADTRRCFGARATLKRSDFS